MDKCMDQKMDKNENSKLISMNKLYYILKMCAIL